MNIYYKIKNTLCDIWYPFKYRCQRFAHGYADEDMFNIDLWFVNTVKPMLVYLKDHGAGFPGEFDDEDEWHNVLAEMINCLDFMDEDYVCNFLGFCEIEDIMKMKTEDFKKVHDLINENKDKFFQLFSKYFYYLWD